MFQHTQDPKQSQLHQWDTAHNPSMLATISCRGLYKERLIYQRKSQGFATRDRIPQQRSGDEFRESLTSASETAEVMLWLREHHQGVESKEQWLYKTEQIGDSDAASQSSNRNEL